MLPAGCFIQKDSLALISNQHISTLTNYAEPTFSNPLRKEYP